MLAFILWATLAAAVAAACLAWPLLRSSATDGAPSRRTAIVAVILLVACAAGLYPVLSHWRWAEAPASSEVSIAPLLEAANAHPDDANAWLQLGQAYLRVEQWPLFAGCSEFDGEPVALESIAADGGQAATIAWGTEWIAWAGIDECNRALNKTEVGVNKDFPLQLIIKDNVTPGKRYDPGLDFKAEYRAMWDAAK